MAENGNQKRPVETQGVQIKVWIPQDFYDLLRARASRFHTSVAEEARKLMQMGLSGLRSVEALNGQMIQMDRFLRQHLEPLSFIAAVDAAYGVESWRQQFQAMVGKRFAGKPEELDRELRHLATKRLQRKLRDLDKAAFDDASESETQEEE